MDRNTILAIVLSVLVITVGMTLQTTLFAPEITEAMASENVQESTVASVAEKSIISPKSIVAVGDDPSSEKFSVRTEVLDIEFNPAGGTISSIKTIKHMADGEPVDLIFREEGDPDVFALYLGNDRENPVEDLFSYKVSPANQNGIIVVDFTRDFVDQSTGKEFTISKKYGIDSKSEYMIQLVVDIAEKDGKPVSFGSDTALYTLSVGPQIGPSFSSLSGNYDYRRVSVKYEDKGSKKAVSFKNGFFSSDDSADWIALSGKYFSFVLIPETNGIVGSVSATQSTENSSIPQKNSIFVTRKASSDSHTTDVYSLYAGPHIKKNLSIYDRSQDNAFGLSDHNLGKILESSWLSWLETILKFFLNIFYRIIPNYGVAIILLTILIKALLQPLTKKGMESTAKMSALTPKIEEIKARYPDDPESQNAAMAKLYKEEKINPAGSCLPMFIQFPVFIALYGLLNTNFELRGAMFIPGWIPDLSIPDTVAVLPFSIPMIGNQIHLLPLIYTVSMIFSMKITQSGTTAGQQQGMMNFMTYGMPIIFLFIMYNAPSGLLLYWTVMNFISIGQQILVNRKKKSEYQIEIQEKDEEKKAKKKKRR